MRISRWIYHSTLAITFDLIRGAIVERIRNADRATQKPKIASGDPCIDVKESYEIDQRGSMTRQNLGPSRIKPVI